MMLPPMSTPVAIIFGIFLIVLGCSFFYKAINATVRGRLMYWEGFLPFTLISPFTLHLPAGKNSLIKHAEGLWVTALMAPIFFTLSILMIAAGVDYVGFPGTDTLNLAINGFKAGRTSVVFNRRTGYKFPIIARSGEQLGKIFGQEIKMKKEDALLQNGENTGSLNDAQQHAGGQ